MANAMIIRNFSLKMGKIVMHSLMCLNCSLLLCYESNCLLLQTWRIIYYLFITSLPRKNSCKNKWLKKSVETFSIYGENTYISYLSYALELNQSRTEKHKETICLQKLLQWIQVEK